MFRPRQNLKHDPKRRWQQQDRVFFGFGACHILAGVFLENPPLPGFYGAWIVPAEGFHGAHVFVTNGRLAFDFRGYSWKDNLLTKYWRGYQRRYPGWSATVRPTDFPLLDTAALNARQHLGPDQYYRDPRPRARAFIARVPLPPEDAVTPPPHSERGCERPTVTGPAV